MAMYDWNGNGKNDRVDDYIEYNICNEGRNEYRFRGGSGSGLGVLFVVFSGLLIQALIYTLLDTKVDDVPAFLIAVLWIGFSSIVAYIMNYIDL